MYAVKCDGRFVLWDGRVALMNNDQADVTLRGLEAAGHQVELVPLTEEEAG